MAMSKEELGNAIIQGTEVTGEIAAVAGPIVALYSPAAGAALTALAPFVEKFIISGVGMTLEFKTMTIDEQKAALLASKFVV